MSIKRSAKEYFTFNRREKRAVLILSSLIVLLAIAPQLYLYVHSDDKVDDKVFEAGVKNYYASQINSESENKNDNNEIIQKDFSAHSKFDSSISEKKIALLFSFDPNTATENDFKKLGLENRTIKSIINYRNKGGQFKSPDDFKKIYTLSEEDFILLKNFIIIDHPSPKENNSEQKSFASYQPKILDINTADSIEWDKLPGIGPYITSKILKYKNALGGFSSVDQIAEVYGMKPETYSAIKERISCDLTLPNSIRKINLNTAGKDELNFHPYINSKQAMVLVNYRDQHGAFKSVDEIKNTDSFTESEFEKIKPYLTVNKPEP
ncbi:competence protein ComEA [Bacteroidota bacterium]|nr:competence protein ComEA [Bacteroidota bacterium]